MYCTTIILLALVLPSAAAADPDTPLGLQPWQDWTLPLDERVADLLSRLSESEKIAQTWSIAPAIPRLNISSYNWRSNCLHGWAASGGAWLPNETWTVFPTPLALGATWDADLVRTVGRVTADEGRALHNLGVWHNNGSSTEARGLNCFSPNVNIFRDPRVCTNRAAAHSTTCIQGNMHVLVYAPLAVWKES